MLAKVSKAYASKGIRVIPLSADEPEDEAKISSMLREFGFEPPYYVARPPLDALKAALHPEWPGNIPVSFILDADARTRYFFNTQVYEQELAPKLDALLQGSLLEGATKHGLAPGLRL
jgi:hypothetical protein